MLYAFLHNGYGDYELIVFNNEREYLRAKQKCEDYDFVMELVDPVTDLDAWLTEYADERIQDEVREDALLDTY